jgi:hypothetical protein
MKVKIIIFKLIFLDNYNIIENLTKKINNFNYLEIEFKHKIYDNISYNFIIRSAYKLYLYEQKYIILLYIKNVNNKFNKTIIYSHGKNETLGSIYSLLYNLSSQLKCNILAYDYSGYGLSDGYPTSIEINNNIIKVINFANNILNLNNNDIILMSNEYGCFPTINLASNNKYKNIYCIILITPIAYINFNKNNDFNKNIFSEENSTYSDIEFFNNKEKINKIFSPIFVIHGQKDNKISINHSKKLIKYMNNYIKWFPHYAGFNEILLNSRDKFYYKISLFLKNTDKIIKKSSENKLDFQNNLISLINSKDFIISKKYGIQREESENNEKNKSEDKDDSNYTMIKHTDTYNYDISEIE